MSRALNLIWLPPRTLRKGCAIAGLLALMQAGVLFGITNVMPSLLSPDEGVQPEQLQLLGKWFLAAMIMPGAIAAWILMLQSENFGSGIRFFLGQLPVSNAQLHHARLRTDLLTILLPVSLTLAIFLVAGATRGLASEIGVLSVHLLVGLLLAIALFELPLLKKNVATFKKIGWFSIVLLPAFGLLYVSSLAVTAIAATVALFLLLRSWNHIPSPTFFAPLGLTEERDTVKQNAVRPGRKTLRKWILRHTLFQWKFLFMAPFMVLYPFMGALDIDYSRDNQTYIVFYFLGILTYSVAMVTKKLDFLPVSRKEILPYLMLPLLPMLSLGVVLAECANMGWIPGLEPLEERVIDPNPDHWFSLQSPIQVTQDYSFVSEKSALRLIVPPQLLEVSSSGATPSLLTETGVDFSPPALPLLWSGGPSLYSPYDIPEWQEGLNPAVLTAQLERALTAFYGESPSAAFLQEQFVTDAGTARVDFQEMEFDKWQYRWSRELKGGFQTQNDYWREQVVLLMPARAIGWITGWGFVLCLVFSLRARYISKRIYLLQQSAQWIGGLGFALYVTNITQFLTGAVRTEGFQERKLMLPSQIVRNLLPANQVLAWVAVAIFFGAVYYLVYRTYRNTEWTSTPQLSGFAKRQYMQWQKI
jgi:hypothetical protein